MTGLADALAGGGRYIKWDEVGQGTVVGGTVTSVTMRQARKFESTELAFWDDGAPQMQAVIEFQTGERLDDDDDGRRSIAVNLWSGQKRALADACRKAGVPEPKPGDEFAAVWISGVGKSKDPRVFAFQITPGSGVSAAIDADPFAAATAAAEPITRPAAPAPKPAPAPAPVVGLNQAALLASLTPEQLAALANLNRA